MSESNHIVTNDTAILIMDYQNDILSMYPDETQDRLLGKASAILDKAHSRNTEVIYVAVRFREGYPEVSMNNKMFGNLKKGNRLVEGTNGADIHKRVSPRKGDIIINKRRVGAFSTTELDTILRAQNITRLILFGIATSGVVLSTVRYAADRDYRLTVIADACADHDEEVHRVLTTKVFPRQAEVITADELLERF